MNLHLSKKEKLMLLENYTEWEILYHIFDHVDNLINTITAINNSSQKKLFITSNSKGGRPSGLSMQTIITFGIFRYAVGIKDIKHYHRYLINHFPEELGHIPTYSNFNHLINQSTPYVIFILLIICHYNKSFAKSLYFIDSSPLKVCENKRIFHHKVCEGIAKRGKSSMGWFFGFKLHVVCDALGRLVSIMITPGNTDDRKFVLKLLKSLKGLCVADAGYISKKLMEMLNKQGLIFITDVKKSMKRLMSKTEHSLLKQRQRVEGVFSSIKHRLNAEASIARSPLGYLSRCLYACLTFALTPHLESKLFLPQF